MDFGFSTPLLDHFRRGEVDREVRLLAASGVLAPRAGEQLALLIFLLDDHDPEIAAMASQTIGAIPREPLAAYLARSEASDDLRRFFAARGVEPAAVAAEKATEPLVEVTPPGAAAEEKDHGSKPIALLPIMERLKLAMRGTREQRAQLIRDPNKLIAVGVLSSPKLTEMEVETFARLGNVSEEVLRIIGRSRSWIKNYGIMSALAKNPKTPPAISLRLVPHLNQRDVKMISMDRNVPEALRMAARKFMVAAESRRQ